MKLEQKKELMRRRIGVLGIWLMFFGILMLLVPLATVSPIGYVTVTLPPGLVTCDRVATTSSGDTNTAVSGTEQAPGEETAKTLSTTDGSAPSETGASVNNEATVAIPTTEPVASPVLASGLNQEAATNIPVAEKTAPSDTLSAPAKEPAVRTDPTLKTGNRVGNLAPGFTLKTTTSESISLSDLKGTKVMLNFWATYCGACIVGSPKIRATYDKHGKNSGDVVVITVCIDARVDRIKKIEDKYGDKYGPFDFPILLDENKTTANSYGIWSVPMTFFIDSQGIIKQVKLGGFQTQDEIESILKSLE
jgi:peroxiredoxin